MRGIVILGVLILLFCSACQGSQATEASSWPRVSLEARLLFVDQTFVDEFQPDTGGYLGLVEEYQRKAGKPGKLSPLQVEVILNATQANERTISLHAPRMMCIEGQAVSTTFRGQTVAFTGGTGRYEAVLTVSLEPKRMAQSPNDVQVDFEMQLIPSDAYIDEVKGLVFSGPDYQFKAEPWPSFHGSFQTASGSTWLIPLPNQATRQAVTEPHQKADHLWLLIRPTLIHSMEEDERLFPWLSGEGNFPSD